MTAAGTIALSAGLAGVLDLVATATVMRAQGFPLPRLLQFIASGALGSSAFGGGKRTAGIGLALHFLIAALAAAVYCAASRELPMLVERPMLGGILYGIALHLVMSQVVVPLSRTPKRPFTRKVFLIQLAIHICCVGLPIALTQSYLAR